VDRVSGEQTSIQIQQKNQYYYHYLVIAILIAVLVFDFLRQEVGLPRALSLLPEVLSGLCLLSIGVWGSISKKIYARFSYIIVLALLLLHMVTGIILNDVNPGTVLSGIRAYLKYIPFFLLPLVYRYSDEHLLKQFKLILFLTFLQIPIAFYQRIIEGSGSRSGDMVHGTLANSSSLSIYLMCAISMLVTFFVRKKIAKSHFFVLVVLLFLPTTINESKGTLVLLPFALLIPVYLATQGRDKIKNTLLAMIAMALLLSIFVPLYDHFTPRRGGEEGIMDFLAGEDRIESYLAPQAMGGSGIGRVDAILLPFRKLSDQPEKLLVGLGIGNMRESFLGSKFSGAYLESYGDFVRASISLLIWELGLVGVVLVVFLNVFIFRDALNLGKNSTNELYSTIGYGWGSIVAVIFIGLFYSRIIDMDAVSYVYWYFSGLVVSLSVRVQST